MIRVRLRIGDGEILDTFTGWGMIYIEADHRTEAPIKERPVSSYAEETGEHVDTRTVQDAFDYTVKFLIECPNRNLTNANAKIAAFNRALYTQQRGSDIRKYKEVTFYNDYKRVKIVGIPEPVAEPTDFYRRDNGSVMDCVQIEFKIRVTNPAKCDFSLLKDSEQPVQLSLSTDGTQLFAHTSNSGYTELRLLTCGSNRVLRNKRDKRYHQKGQFRWHNSIALAKDENGVLSAKSGKSSLFPPVWTPTANYDAVRVRKAANSHYRVLTQDGISKKITYGIAAYKGKTRVSNVAFFASEVNLSHSANGTVNVKQSLSIK